MFKRLYDWLTQEPEDYRFLENWFEKNDGKIEYSISGYTYTKVSCHADDVKVEVEFFDTHTNYHVLVGRSYMYASNTIRNNMSSKSRKLIYSKIRHLLQCDKSKIENLKEKYLS